MNAMDHLLKLGIDGIIFFFKVSNDLNDKVPIDLSCVDIVIPCSFASLPCLVDKIYFTFATFLFDEVSFTMENLISFLFKSCISILLGSFSIEIAHIILGRY